MSRDKSRKKQSFSQWVREHKDRLKRVKIQTSHDGNPNWRSRKSYKRWRKKVLERDEGTCRFCGSTENPTVHHVIPASVAPELRLEPFNGWVLCEPCHREYYEFLHLRTTAFWRHLVRRR